MLKKSFAILQKYLTKVKQLTQEDLAIFRKTSTNVNFLLNQPSNIHPNINQRRLVMLEPAQTPETHQTKVNSQLLKEEAEEKARRKSTMKKQWNPTRNNFLKRNSTNSFRSRSTVMKKINNPPMQLDSHVILETSLEKDLNANNGNIFKIGMKPSLFAKLRSASAPKINRSKQ